MDQGAAAQSIRRPAPGVQRPRDIGGRERAEVPTCRAASRSPSNSSGGPAAIRPVQVVRAEMRQALPVRVMRRSSERAERSRMFSSGSWTAWAGKWPVPPAGTVRGLACQAAGGWVSEVGRG